MDRKPTSLPGETWEFFSSCIYYLGKSVLTALFQRGERQIERWSADPSTTSENHRNPVDRYEILLQKLMDEGHKDISKAIVSRQAHIVDCELVNKEMPKPDKETIEHELIDDLAFKVKFDTVLLDPKSTQRQCYLAMENSINELKENYVKKCMDNGWKP